MMMLTGTHLSASEDGIRDRPISPRSPWENAYAERRRNASARLFGSCPYLRRAASAANPALFPPITMRRARPYRWISPWDYCRYAHSVRAAPSVRGDTIFGKDSIAQHHARQACRHAGTQSRPSPYLRVCNAPTFASLTMSRLRIRPKNSSSGFSTSAAGMPKSEVWPQKVRLTNPS
jgi:hypothetical protein